MIFDLTVAFMLGVFFAWAVNYFCPKQRKRKSTRYAVVKESVTTHCCFKASVVDTDKIDWTDRRTGEKHHKVVCEAFTVEEAEMIAKSLNETDSGKTNVTE